MPIPDPVFRFGIMRAPEPPPVLIAIGPHLVTTSFGVQLLNLRRNQPDREPIVQRVQEFLASPDFVGDPERIPLHDQLVRFDARLQSSESPLLEAATNAIQPVFAMNARQLIQTPDYGQSRIQLIDALLALKIGHQPRRTPIERFARLFKLLELIRVVVEAPASLDGVTFASWMRAPIHLPEEIYPLPPRATGAEDEPLTADESAEAQEIERLRTEIDAIGGAEQEWLNIRAVQRSDLEGDRIGRPGIDTLVLAPQEAERLSDSTRRVLETVRATAASSSFFGTLDRLEQARNILAMEVRDRSLRLPARARIRVAGTTLPSPSPAEIDDLTQPEPPHSPVSPAGVMDLLITRQQIKRYEAGEIAHIENVMQTESRKRETRRLERTEETFTVEREEITTEERDLQTTERSELQRETLDTLSEEQRFKLGFKLGAKFGPIITEASTEFEVSSASQESSKTASAFARELTERAASKVSTRVREEQTIRTLQEFEDKNSHGFDNTAGTTHVVGIYQWIDKVYELQVYSFGIRMMFDLAAPEPAAFLLRTLELELASAEGISKPEAINFTASDIDFTNYLEYAARYEATVQPPPPPYKTVGHVFAREGAMPAPPPEGEEETAPPPPATAVGASINIPNGYVAFAAWANAQARFTGPDTPGIELPRVTMQIGQIEIHRLESGSGDDIQMGDFVLLNLERDAIPVAVLASDTTVFYASVEIWCIRSYRALEQWRIETFDAIVQAYRQRLSEYEQKIAEAAAREGVQIQGRNPAINRKIEREEYQRLAIKMIANESFSDTHTRIQGFNRLAFNVPEANRKGRFARFWTSALDIDNLQAELLPYFWSKKGKKWRDKLLLENTDPEHAAFLKAGAVRLLVAVNPGFERAVLHFLDTGEIWPGGEEPAITNPAYAALLADIERNRERQLTEEIPTGEPWEIKLPTTLVRLRPDGTLPEWSKHEDGVWRPVEPE